MSIFAIWFTFALLLLSGLIVESAGKLGEEQRLEAAAAQAARAGGQQIVASSAVRGDGTTASPAAAAAAARAFLAASHTDGSVSVTPTNLHVATSGVYHTKILSIIGISTLAVHGEGDARLVRAVNGVES